MNVPHRFDNDNGAALIYFARFSGLKPQHNPAALGIIAAQAPQRIALYLYSWEAVLNLDAKLQCKGWILTMSDPNAPALAAKPFHLV